MSAGQVAVAFVMGQAIERDRRIGVAVAGPRVLRAIAGQVLDSRRPPGFDRVYPPGYLEAETEARFRVEGIPLNALTLAGLATEAIRPGLDRDLA